MEENCINKLSKLSVIWKDHAASKYNETEVDKDPGVFNFPLQQRNLTIKEEDQRRINVLQMWHIEVMLRILWMEKRTNKCILKELGVNKSLFPYATTKFSNYLYTQYFSNMTTRKKSLSIEKLKEKVLEKLPNTMDRSFSYKRKYPSGNN